MPWREVCPMDEKVRLIAALVAREESVTAVCASSWVSAARLLTSGFGDIGSTPRRD